MSTGREDGSVRFEKKRINVLLYSFLFTGAVLVMFLVCRDTSDGYGTDPATYSLAEFDGEPKRIRKKSGVVESSLHVTASSSGYGAASAPVAAFSASALVECVLVTSIPIEGSSPSASAATTANGVLQITLRPDLSPLAVAAFVDLVKSRYYNGIFVFRVIKGFIVQWGFRPDWMWDNNRNSSNSRKKRKAITDAVHDGSLSNTRGTLTFAGGSTVQVFVNLGDNSRLDGEGSRPFATLNAHSVALAERIYSGYKGGSGQIPAITEGKEAVIKKFPRMSMIDNCRVVDSFSVPK